MSRSDLFAPEWTDYVKRINYRTYDVTGLMKKGDNAHRRCAWRRLVRRLCRLAEDPRPLWPPDQPYGSARGRIQRRLKRDYQPLTSRGRQPSARYRSSDFMMGETYDARKEMPGWAGAGFDEGDMA